MTNPHCNVETAADPATNARQKPPVDAGEASRAEAPAVPPKRPREIGGPSGPEPTRYGDWERNGRVSDF